MLTRRSFLGTSVAGLGGVALTHNWISAAARIAREPARRLVVIELRGGLDGLAALQPHDDRLLRVRPTIAKPQAQLCGIAADCGLHPKLSRTAARFHAGGLGIWRGVGHDAPNLSHFESRDYWDEGRVTAVRSGAGWLGRFGETMDADPLTMLAIGDGALPGSMRGVLRRAPAVRGLTGLALRGPDSRGNQLAPLQTAAIERMLQASKGDSEREFLSRMTLETAEAARRLGAAESLRPKANWPRSRLATDLGAVAAVIESDLPTRVFHVVQNGFDTHADQAADLDRLLAETDSALEAFLAHLERKNLINDVLVMTTSEFGRRVAESGEGGNAGTDHGTANVLFFAGGKVRPGLFGNAPDLGELDGSGNYAATTDFRSLYASVLTHWLVADATALLDGSFAAQQVVNA